MTDNTAWWILGLAGVLRLVMAAIVPIVPDEAYYWEWSRHLAAGYFDHPAAIAVLIRAGTLIAGNTPFGVRCVAVLVGTIATVAAVALAQRFGGAVAAQRAAWAVLAMPLAGAGLVLATPGRRAIGVPWPRASHGRSWRSSSTRPIAWWAAAGLALGCGLESKYTAVLFGVGIALALEPARSREQWRRPGPYVAILVAAVVFLPVVLWNAGHRWISFRFQLQLRLPPRGTATSSTASVATRWATRVGLADLSLS